MKLKKVSHHNPHKSHLVHEDGYELKQIHTTHHRGRTHCMRRINQCGSFSRSIAQVTPKIIYLYYLKKTDT